MNPHLKWILSGLRRDLDNLLPGQNSALSEVKEKLIAVTRLWLGVDSSYEQEIAQISGNWDVAIEALKQWVDTMLRELDPEGKTSMRENHPKSTKINLFRELDDNELADQPLSEDQSKEQGLKGNELDDQPLSEDQSKEQGAKGNELDNQPLLEDQSGEEGKIIQELENILKKEAPVLQKKFPKDDFVNETVDSLLLEMKALPFLQAGNYDAAIQVFLDGLKQYPNSEGLWVDYADVLMKKREFLKAIEACKKAIAIKSNTLESWQMLGNCEARLSHFQNAVDAYKKVLEIDPLLWEYWGFLGATYKSLGNLQETVRAYEQALKIVPNDVKIWTDLGIVRSELGDFLGSESAHKKAIAIDPNFAPAWNNLAANYIEVKDYVKAEQTARKAVEINPNYGKAHITLSVALQFQKHCSEAESENLKAQELDSQNADTWSNLGQIRLLSNDYSGAISAYERAVHLNPKDLFSWNNLANCKEHIGDLVGAEYAYHKAIELDPLNPLPHINLGHARMKQNCILDAIACFQEAVTISPNLAIGWVHLSEAYLKNGTIAEAKSAFQKAKELNATEPFIREKIDKLAERFQKSEISRDEINDRENTALKQIRQSVDMSVPSVSNEDIAHRLKKEADEFYAQGKINQARGSYLEYLKRIPSDVEVWSRLGEMSIQAGKKQRAEREFQECLKHNPNHAHAKDRLEQLNRLKERKASS